MLLKGWHRSTGGATPEPPERLLRTESNRHFNTTAVQAVGDHSAQEAQEGALQELCMDILGSLDVSASGMSKVSHNLTCCHSLPSHHVFLIPFQHPRSLLQCALKHTRLREIHRVLFISERRQEC